jgi:hypothetical protein
VPLVLATIPSFQLLLPVAAAAAVTAAITRLLVGRVAVVTGVQGLLAPEHREHLAKVTLVVMELLLLAAVVVGRLLLVTVLLQSAVAMAVLDLLGATDLPTQAAEEDTETFPTDQAALVAAGAAGQALQIQAGVAVVLEVLMAQAAPAL